MLVSTFSHASACHYYADNLGDGVAFSHSLNHGSATTADGTKINMWWRSTVCYRQIGGEWKIAHEHNSVPFDPTTGKASLNLAP